MPKPTKYRSLRTNGYASKKEAKRAAELKLLERAGVIRLLREQVTYELIPQQKELIVLKGQKPKVIERACSYVADFVYEEPIGGGWALHSLVVEDCKGMRTREYIIKRKLLLWMHVIRIREI